MGISRTSESQLLKENRKLHSELAVGKIVTVSHKEELRKSEERFSLAMLGAHDGLWDWNLETDEVYYSPRWMNMLGYGELELPAHLDTWKMLVHPDDRERVMNCVQDNIEGRDDSFEIEMLMVHKAGHAVLILSRAFLVKRESDNKAIRMVGTHVDITERMKTNLLVEQTASILEMIAIGRPATKIYDAIALMYEGRHPGLRCSMLELHGNKLLHGGAPSLPKEYCEAVHGLENGPDVGSCGTSTYTGNRVLVENIETDPKWEKIKHVALPHGMRCCWSEPIIDSSGEVLGAFGMYYNHPALPNEKESADLESAARLAGIVMERDHAQKRIRELAFNDELTGLASRAHFYQHLATLIKNSSRYQQRFALLYIDLDHFKNINDSLGHDAGDKMLKTIADRLRFTCRESDYIARLSGDEFCVLVEEVEEDYSANVAQRCLEAVSQPLELGARKVSQACSIGIAHFPDDGDDETSLVKAADTSLYAAKENGRNCYAFYNRELTEKAEYRFLFEQYLREAIEQEQLSLVYQPQIDVATGKMTGVEALSRWQHPQLGDVQPSEFIPIAEKMGMIRPLTEWVLRTACHQAMAWRKQGLPPLMMSVNISPSHFLEKGLVPLIRQTIEETGINPNELVLEVTEGVVQTDVENLRNISDLKELGVMLAIDDFGTGYSSFASLKHMQVDDLKIDKYFIDDMIADEQSMLLVSSMIDIGHKLGYRVIAEGVESTEQLDLLRNLGCETVQGFLFSRAVSGSDIASLVLGDI